MKKAVIVTGRHFAGKSKTIKKYFKPLIGLTSRQRNFSNGRVLSQSLEERGLDSVKNFISRYGDFKYLVCAARPDGEIPSLFRALKIELERIGYTVFTVLIEENQKEKFYKSKANEIYNYLYGT